MTTHQELRKNHYERMNAYRQSAEYQEYAKAIGYTSHVDDKEYPSLFVDKWEIDEEIYWDFIEMLPPIYCKGGFYMCELTFDNITNKFTKDGDKYYCEFSRLEKQHAA